MGWEGRGREGEDKESPLPIAAREAFVKREKRRGMEGGGRRATGKYTRPTSHHPLRRPFAPRIGFRFDVMPDTTRRLLVQRLIFLLLVFVFSKTALQRFPNILNISSRMTTQGRRPSKADKKTTERKKKGSINRRRRSRRQRTLRAGHCGSGMPRFHPCRNLSKISRSCGKTKGSQTRNNKQTGGKQERQIEKQKSSRIVQ